MSRFNLPLVNGREGGREKGAGAFEPPRGYENHGVEEHFFFPPPPPPLHPSPSLLLFARSPQACSISAVSDCSEFRERRGAPFERVSGFWREGGQWRFQSGLFEWLSIRVLRYWSRGFGAVYNVTRLIRRGPRISSLVGKSEFII